MITRIIIGYTNDEVYKKTNINEFVKEKKEAVQLHFYSFDKH